ncbi:hypothetical protein L210DRAFT_3344157, partial [Boletus edulis BED1]
IQEAHNSLGHKGVFSVRTHLLLRFWWPMLVDDVKWFIRTCHECQIRQTKKLHIPPTVPVIGGLFHKVHINTMVMLRSGGYRFIIILAPTLSACSFGTAPLLSTLHRYGIRHIRISPYNSQANGVVERLHYDVQEAIVKSTLGGDVRWPLTAHSVFWAEQVTILKSTGLSPYFMVHGVELLFPFDLAEATFLVPLPDTDPTSRTSLIAWRAQQLQKRREDIDTIREQVL